MKGPRSIIPALLAVCWLAPLRAEAQSGTIRGHVNDAAGKGLSGAIVSYSSRTVQTRADGSYSLIGISAGTDTLRAKMIGYGSTARAVTVRSGQTLDADLVLTAQAVSLAEIVVTGYGEQRAGDITGAVTSVSDSQFNTGRIVSPQMLIQSKVAGVQVVDNNDPGGGLSIRIRGATSVNASSEPLYVVDGVPLGTGAGAGLSAGRDPLNFLNPRRDHHHEVG